MKSIEINKLSKLYKLGNISTGSLAHDINRWWHRVRNLEDPYSRIAQTNLRDQKGESDYVWSLKDIDLTVNQGDILGIIGKNGAGKSTLLKILSRVTGPTSGTVKMRGRVASLLEVGTGFHPDLTGRENIFLNGAILGMTKREIKKKMDEIVNFSGVERYIDTPVKRYSSGMYVRLAFAVAAHLEPEILIVDEVLAVGDAEFQKKCIGKMKDVSDKDGRTVLFVSHNLASMKQLCTSGIVLKDGLLDFQGTTNDAIDHYLNLEKIKELNSEFIKKEIEDKDVQLIEGYVLNSNKNKTTLFDISDDIIIKLNILCKQQIPKLYAYIAIKNQKEEIIIESDTFDYLPNVLENLEIGENIFHLKINRNILGIGDYSFYINFSSNYANTFHVDSPKTILGFSVMDNSTQRGNTRRAKTSFLLKWEKQVVNTM